jgi:hypothetical protein
MEKGRKGAKERKKCRRGERKNVFEKRGKKLERKKKHEGI